MLLGGSGGLGFSLGRDADTSSYPLVSLNILEYSRRILRTLPTRSMVTLPYSCSSSQTCARPTTASNLQANRLARSSLAVTSTCAFLVGSMIDYVSPPVRLASPRAGINLFGIPKRREPLNSPPALCLRLAPVNQCRQSTLCPESVHPSGVISLVGGLLLQDQ